MGAAGGMAQVLQKAVGLIVGGAGGFFINDALKKAFTSLPTFVPGAVVLVGGIFVDKTLAKNNQLIHSVADGLQVAGGLVILNETVISLPGISGVGFVTNYDKAYKDSPALMKAVGAPGFMDSSIGTVRDLASVGSGRVGAIYDN